MVGPPSYSGPNSSLAQELSYDPRGVMGSKHGPGASILSIVFIDLTPHSWKKEKEKNTILPATENFSVREDCHLATHTSTPGNTQIS